MTINHTGHASIGCANFDLTNVRLVSRLTPDENNANALMGVKLCCRECGRDWGAMVGGWRIRPDGVYCERCAEEDS